MTRVVFRKFRDGQIIALFPDMPWSRHGYTTTSYMHSGQHGAADYTEAVAMTQPATGDEYRALLDELKAAGYDNLRIIRRARPVFNLKNNK